MARRRRSRSHASAVAPRLETAGGDRERRSGSRQVRTGAPRAIGEPSAVLERAATVERTYVLKDFRRMAVVCAIVLGLLVASGVAVTALVR